MILKNYHRQQSLLINILFNLLFLLVLISCSSRKPEGTSILAPTISMIEPTKTPFPHEPQPSIGTIETRSTDQMAMVFVPGGAFPMGSDFNEPYTGDDEKPIHSVSLSNFWIDQTEVTNGQYTLCVTAGACKESVFANNPEFNGIDYPVVGVSWLDAESYCDWAGSQLPTEAQWEYAARGPDGNKYPWGDNIPTCELAQYTKFSSCSGRTVKVGSLTNGASWVKTFDMAGNVVEWVQDWYDPDYYENSPLLNPTGPSTGDLKVVRGGSWGDPGPGMQMTLRFPVPPNVTSDQIGFRCATPELEE